MKENNDYGLSGVLTDTNYLLARTIEQVEETDKQRHECYEELLKSLEVLEILKQNIVCKDGTTTTFDTRNDKVKEWLENDK